MDLNLTTIISLAALGVAILTLLDKYYGTVAAMKAKISVLEGQQIDPLELEKRLSGIEKSVNSPNFEVNNRLAALELKVSPLWKVLEDHMVDLLKQPTHLRMDSLLDEYKRRRGEMNLDDMMELKKEILLVLQEARANNNPKMFGYVIMLGILESRICEKISVESCTEERGKGDVSTA